MSTQAQGVVVKERLKKFADQFHTLPVAKQKAYISLKNKAFKARQQQKYLTCLVAINDAQQIFRNDMDLLFLNGICRAQIHDIDKALEYYNEVLAIDPQHVFTLMNVIEINFFGGRYQEAIKYITKMNKLVNSRGKGQKLPLLDFKKLVALTKLAEKDPGKYAAEVNKTRELYTFMDDHPFYYYAKALESLEQGDKQEGLIWILKAYLIFGNPALIETWNKALVDTGYIGAHEIMFNRRKSQ